MKTVTLIVAAACLVLASFAQAVAIHIQESGCAQISPRPETYAAPNYPSNINAGAGVNTLMGMNPSDGRPLAFMILWYFNLAAHSGLVFNGDVTISCGQGWGEAGPLNFRLYTVADSWSESTVTWENFLGPDTTNNMGYTSYPGNNQAYTNVLGKELTVTACTGTSSPTNPEGTNNWTFAGSQINYMLAQPSQNLGFALVPDWWGNMMWCTRQRNWQTPRIPTLHADVVPEPSLLALAFGGLLLAIRRR